jgi:hypothetical protein
MSNPTVVFQDASLPSHVLAIVDYEGRRSIGLYKENQVVVAVDQDLLRTFIEQLTLFEKIAAQVALTPAEEEPTAPETVEVYPQPHIPMEDPKEKERLDYEASLEKEDPTASYLLDPEEF